MGQFTLRHLFLLTSFFCLWFGAYAYWRNVVVFALPLFCGYASAVVGFLHFNKNKSVRLKRVGLLTLANMVGSFAGVCIPASLVRSSFGLTAVCYVWLIMLQGAFVAFQALICVAASRRRVIALGFVLSAMNLILALLMLQVLFDLSHFL